MEHTLRPHESVSEGIKRVVERSQAIEHVDGDTGPRETVHSGSSAEAYL